MNLQFVPKGIELVQQAIAADNDKDYEKAYGLYKQSLDHFLLALKYEKNKAAKENFFTDPRGNNEGCYNLTDFRIFSYNLKFQQIMLQKYRHVKIDGVKNPATY